MKKLEYETVIDALTINDKSKRLMKNEDAENKFKGLSCVALDIQSNANIFTKITCEIIEATQQNPNAYIYINFMLPTNIRKKEITQGLSTLFSSSDNTSIVLLNKGKTIRIIFEVKNIYI